MKILQLIITFIVFLFDDIIGNLLVDMKGTQEWIENMGVSVAWFRLFLVIVNFIVGVLYFRRYAPLLIQSIWIVLYLFIISYFLIRWFLNVMGLLSDSFSLNSHLSLGLSVFTFGIFYFINRKLKHWCRRMKSNYFFVRPRCKGSSTPISFFLQIIIDPIA